MGTSIQSSSVERYLALFDWSPRSQTWESYSQRRRILFNYTIKMKITCVIVIIMSFLVWENAAWDCFGKTKNQCSKANDCDWHTVWTFIGWCYKIEDEDKIFLGAEAGAGAEAKQPKGKGR